LDRPRPRPPGAPGEVALHDFPPENLTSVARLFERDGYRLEDGRITGGPVIVLREGVLSGLTDPAAIREHLDRIARAIEDDDAAQAISSAKELIESTAKIVLHERGLPVDDKEDLPQLVRAAQVALAVHPASASPGPDGSDAVKKILGGATAVATYKPRLSSPPSGRSDSGVTDLQCAGRRRPGGSAVSVSPRAESS
jgi:hypothetical protein